MIGTVATERTVLSIPQRAFLATARRAVLATIARGGRPRLIPICFILDDERPLLWTPIDDKAKRTDDPFALARVRDIGADPRVTLLVDRWDEDWEGLAWLRCEGRATIVEPAAIGHAPAIEALRAKYLQYATHRLETRPLIGIEIERVTSWGLEA